MVFEILPGSSFLGGTLDREGKSLSRDALGVDSAHIWLKSLEFLPVAVYAEMVQPIETPERAPALNSD